jgi:CheY-like chemotaxis protein
MTVICETLDYVDILLVEDSPTDLELTQSALGAIDLDCRVQVARDGEEALDLLLCRGPFRKRDMAGGPRVVLLDLKLPRIDGLDVLRELRQDPRTRTLPVVVLTSSAEDRDLVESYQLGVNSYIVKPVDFEKFTAVIKELGIYWLLRNQQPSGLPHDA